MFSRFLVARNTSPYGNVIAGGSITPSVSTNFSRYCMRFECADPANVPTIIKTYPTTSPTHEEVIRPFGDSGGVMLAPFFSNINASTSVRITFSEAVNNVYVQDVTPGDMLYSSRSVGPVSINTYGPRAVVPFTVAITCKPLFLEPFPALRKYGGPIGTVSGLSAFFSSLVGDYEWNATEKVLNKEVRCGISYAYDSVASIGKVISATLRPAYVTSGISQKYATVADLVIGIPEGGLQDSVIIGSENPANYLKRSYQPRRGSHDELGFEQMPPILLECTEVDEVQASGRLRYEHSILLLSEPPVNKYIVSVNVIEGAGNVSIYDNEQEYAELSEYEY